MSYQTRLLTVLCVLIIVTVSFLTYKDILSYYYTGPDTLPLIKTNRMESAGDVTRIFTQKLMNETGFTSTYYRPISSLSFSIDYMIWKLNPFGYHLTDLILHILVSVSIFFFTRLLMKGDQIIPWLAAIIFATHPALMSNVPVISRRQDIIAALFLLLSLSMFLKSFYQRGSKKLFLLLSLFSYVVALGAKEIAIIVPALIFAYTAIFSEKAPFKEKVAYSLKESLPFFVLTLAYLMWRTYVLSGLGGLEERVGFLKPVLMPIRYFKLLLFPLALPSISGPVIDVVKIFIPILAIIILTYTVFHKKDLFLIKGRSKKIFSVFCALLFLAAVLSAIAFILSPLALPSVYNVFESIHEKNAPKFLYGAIKLEDIKPVEHYSHEAGTLLQGTLLFVLFISGSCLVSLLKFEEIKKFTLSTISGKSCLFCLCWLIFPLGIYVITLTFSSRCMYIPVIPFSILLSIGLSEGFRSCRKHWKVYKPYKDKGSRSLLVSKSIGLLILIALSISLLLTSPLVVSYKDWENAGEISFMYLGKFAEIVPGLPNNSVIYLYGFPYWFGYPALAHDIGPAMNLVDYSIKSWIDLHCQRNDIEVFVKTYSYLKKVPDDIDMHVESDGKSVRILAIYKYN